MSVSVIPLYTCRFVLRRFSVLNTYFNHLGYNVVTYIYRFTYSVHHNEHLVNEELKSIVMSLVLKLLLTHYSYLGIVIKYDGNFNLAILYSYKKTRKIIVIISFI